MYSGSAQNKCSAHIKKYITKKYVYSVQKKCTVQKPCLQCTYLVYRTKNKCTVRTTSVLGKKIVYSVNKVYSSKSTVHITIVKHKYHVYSAQNKCISHYEHLVRSQTDNNFFKHQFVLINHKIFIKKKIVS